MSQATVRNERGFRWSAALLILAALPSCSDNSPMTPRRITWRTETFVGYASSAIFASKMWGTSGQNIYAIGGGSISHFDGQRWSFMEQETGEEYTYREEYMGIWGIADKVFVVGRRNSIWSGLIRRYDGSGWVDVYTGSYPSELSAVWGISEQGIFAVGSNGTILRFDGATWNRISSGSGANLRAVWGTSASDVFVGTDNGKVLHYDGQSWDSTSVGDANMEIREIWGRSSQDVYAIEGLPRHYNSGPGIILHFDGSAWSEIHRSDWPLAGLWGSPQGDLFVSGYELLRYDGASWIQMDCPLPLPYPSGPVWGSSSTDVWVGSRLRYDGVAWRAVSDVPFFSGIWSSPGRAAFAVGRIQAGRGCFGEGDGIARFDDMNWNAMGTGFGIPIRSIWGASESDVFTVGDCGTILRFDGARWQRMESGTDRWLTAVWGSASHDVFAVGGQGTILHYDGSTWVPMQSGTEFTLYGVWGSSSENVFAVGEYGAIFHYDGSGWTRMVAPYGGTLNAIWGASPNSVYAVGQGRILHYDGRWREMPGPRQGGYSYGYLNAVWGRSDSDVYAAGNYGVMIHYDGLVWTPVDTGANADFYGIAGGDGEEVFVVGVSGYPTRKGLILRGYRSITD
jgi:hypothetical protein